MVVDHEGMSSNDESTILPQVIKSKFRSTSRWLIPRCAACELARAQKQNPDVTKQQAIRAKEDVFG